MQRERSALDSFPEPIDLNQGSLPNNTSMDHSASWDNMLSPVDNNRLSNYMLASDDGNATCTNDANETAPSFNGWDRGESSSSANNMHDGAIGEGSKTSLGLSSVFKSCSGSDARSENWSFEPPNISITSNVGNHVAGRSPSVQNYSSTHGHGREHDYHNRGHGVGLPHSVYKSSHSEMEQIPNLYASSSNFGTFSGSSSTVTENNDASGPSFGTWGSSCKRKAVEGSSGQFYPGGSSSSNQPMGKNIMQHHPVPGFYSAPGNLSISSGPLNLSPSPMNHSEQLNPSSGIGVSRAATPGFFPSSSVAESSVRSFGIRSNHGRHESAPFDATRSTSARSFTAYAAQLSRPISNTDSPEMRSPMTPPINPNNTLIDHHAMHVNEARGMHSYPWSGSFSSPGGSSSSSFLINGERGFGAREEVNVRSSRRSHREYPVTVSATETRNALQDQIDWSFAPRNSASTRNHSSVSRVGQSSGGRSSSTSWLPHHNHTSSTHQRLSEAAPWSSPFHNVESESGNSRSHFALLPSASSSSNDAASTSRAQHQLDQRSAALLMDMPGDDINGWRALTAVEGRHRLIRQVLNAMRRGVHLQAEDYMLVDPFINGFAELHDRHRDMRLDVDNMSYEELLALEERIGNVNTGLSEEQIRGSMKQRKHEAMQILPNLEPCCICQEEYVAGDNIGILDCGHEFHSGCVKQWLTLKNLCPICKMTALKT